MKSFPLIAKLLLSLFVLLVISSCTELDTAINPTNPGTISTVNPHAEHSHVTTTGSDITPSTITTSALTSVGDRTIPVGAGIGQLASPTAPLQMKLLIISATSEDSGLQAAESLMKQVGVPYDVLIASEQTLTEASLMDGEQGKYQGIILTTSGLPYDTGNGVWASALDPTEWQTLWNYESSLAVRQLTLYAFPSIYPEDYGIAGIDTNGDSWPDGNSNETTMSITTEGQAVFSSLKANANIPVKYAYMYPSVLDATNGITATPILKDNTGNILGVLSTSADGRERLALTMGHNPYVLHTQLLGYDMLHWLTQGVFIGERRMYLSVDIDDWYLESAVWNPATNSNHAYEDKIFRLTAKDVYAARDGVLDIREKFNAPTFNYIQVFNASKGDPNARVNCDEAASLSASSLCLGTFFDWVSHTLSHADMTNLNYAEARLELEKNIDFAESQPLEFDKKFLVTGRHSGLGWKLISEGEGLSCEVDQVTSDEYCQFGLKASNVNMLNAAADLGIEYLAANRGWNTHTRADGCDTCLIVHPLDSRIKLIPRWPTNIFYNTTTPAENASEFNNLYGPNGVIKDGNGNPFFSVDQNWTQVLNFEAEIALRHILSFSPYPHFFHQNNLMEYSQDRSLLYDWSSAVLTEYSKYFDIPIISQDWELITKTLEERTTFFEGLKTNAISGTWNRVNNTVSISRNGNHGMVFVTGAQLNRSTTHYYGETQFSKRWISSGQTIAGTIVATSSKPTLAIGYSTAAITGTEGESLSLSPNNLIEASKDYITFKATNLPLGLAIDPATGTISGTYACDTAGNYNTQIFISNGTSSSIQTLTWTVSENAALDCWPTTLYQNANYQGTAYGLDLGDYNRLPNAGIPNDRISSLKIAEGYAVELYQHYSFGGEKIVLTSDSDILPSLDNQASSAKVYKILPTTLYEDINLEGSAYELSVGDYNWLPNVGIPNDRISSLKVTAGYVVELYQNWNFLGEKIVLTSDSDTLPSLDNKVSSIKVFRQ